MDSAGNDLLISMLAKPSLFDWSNNTGAIDVKMDGSVLFDLLRCWGWLSVLNWIGAFKLSLLLKTASKEIGALIRCMKFLSPEVAPEIALYLYKSTIHPCIEYCYDVWAGAPSSYLELSDKLQKQIWRTGGALLATSLERLAHCWNLASLSNFYRYYFGRCSSEVAQLAPLPYSWKRSNRYSARFFLKRFPVCLFNIEDWTISVKKRTRFSGLLVFIL